MVKPASPPPTSPTSPGAPGEVVRAGEAEELGKGGTLPWVRTGVVVAGGALLAVVVAWSLATWVDGPVSRWVYEAGVSGEIRRKASWAYTLSRVIKWPGEIWLAVVVAGVLVARVKWAGRQAWWGMWLVLLAAGASGSNAIFKWVAGRQRPFRDGVFASDPNSWMPFRGGLEGLVNQSNLSFPSGHTTHAFALATAVAVLFPRWGWLGYVAAVLTGAERVLSNGHYPSEVFGGAVLGTACTLAVLAVLRALARSQDPATVPEVMRRR